MEALSMGGCIGCVLAGRLWTYYSIVRIAQREKTLWKRKRDGSLSCGCVRLLRASLALCAFVCLQPCWADVLPSADAAEQLTATSSAIREKLTDLKAQSASMTALCETLQTSLEKSQAELAEWKAQSTALSYSLMSINEQLNDCYTTMTRYEEKLRARGRLVALLGVILIARFFCMIAGYILYARGVHLPRWVDILL